MSWHRDFLNTKREEYREQDGINYPRVVGSYESMISCLSIYLEVYHPNVLQEVIEKVMLPSLSSHS